MLALISPAKKLMFEEKNDSLPITDPVFVKDANALAMTAKKLTRTDLKQMMKISDNLAELNWHRFQSFAAEPEKDAVKQAALAFAGDTYAGLDAESLDADDMKFAQDHLRILSGLYGLLKPLDAIQPYRLEMGRRIKTRRGENLYDYWGDRISNELDKELKAQESKVVINLASGEYIKAVAKKALKAPMIDMVFKQKNANEYRIIGLMAKRARGAMARYMIKHRIEEPEELKAFDAEGYRFRPSMSNDTSWVFTQE